MIEATPISAFPNAKSTEPTTVTLGQFLRSTRHQDKVIAVRTATDKKQRDELKKRLPGATISGTFTKRAADHISQYNGLVCMDFDADANPTLTTGQMKNILTQLDEVAYVGLSAGGKGVFAIVPTNLTDPTHHAAIVDILGAAFAALGLTYDRSCKDVSRLRFVSYDPDAWWNPAPVPFDATKILALKAAHEESRPPRPLVIRQTRSDSPPYGGGAGGGVKTDRTRERVEALISAVEHARHDVVDDYDDWLRIGFAIASEFGMGGKDYFLRISQFHHPTKRNPEKKYDELLKNGKKVKIGTFFKILENKGFSL